MRGCPGRGFPLKEVPHAHSYISELLVNAAVAPFFFHFLFFLVLNIFSGKRLAAVLGVGKKRRKQHGIPAGTPSDGEEAAAKPRVEERNGRALRKRRKNRRFWKHTRALRHAAGRAK